MFFNKLRYPLVLVVLFVAGLAFVATPATEAVTPVLSVPDELTADPDTADTEGIQVYGIRAESVSFELTITFGDGSNPPMPTPVTGFDATDIELFAFDVNENSVQRGAAADAVHSNAAGSVYTTTITAGGRVNSVIIRIPAAAANTILSPQQVRDSVNATPSDAATPLEVEIIRSAAPPLTLSPDKSIGGNAPFTVTLTSTTAITLTEADIKVTDGFIPTNGITSDAAKRVWTVTIHPGAGVTQVTVEPSATGAYIFSKGTFTVDTTGPVARITPIPVGGGVYSVTIAFDEPLQAGATLIASEISVIGASIGVLSPIPATSSYVATLIPDSGATTVTVQIKAGAVADAGGVPNAATPSPAHTFQIAATGTPPGTGTAPRRGSVRELTGGKVTISEIMFATAGGTRDIQWIELFNSSETEAVALDADTGWELIIKNYNDPRSSEEPRSGTINFKDSGDVKTISPNQSVLIVSSSGRNSDSNHFVLTRVFSVYSELRAEFGMNSGRDPFLNPTEGFHIKLVDGRGNDSDEVGNLDGRIRTADEPAWTLPDGWTEDDDRTSILRRYRRGTERDGTRQDGWIRAADTDFSWISRKRVTRNGRSLETWYGSVSDYGSPGFRAGHALPVELSHFRPERTESGAIVIQWTTQSEVDNAGFNILRSQTKTGEFKVVNAQLIPGAGTKAESTTYTWTDTTAKPNVVYYYQIEDVSFAGEHQTLATVRLKGFVSAKGKLATQWGVLKQSRD
ncbi:MAG: lamin tail domain-containing protein [Candidatus Poribacteria bacterium]|nr:lamin tail domain-containing protein [Candidatus Poribacteria bacterium]